MMYTCTVDGKQQYDVTVEDNYLVYVSLFVTDYRHQLTDGFFCIVRKARRGVSPQLSKGTKRRAGYVKNLTKNYKSDLWFMIGFIINLIQYCSDNTHI